MKNSSQVKYGYIDESGTPGAAVNGNDWLVVSLVVFKSRENKEKSEAELEELREKLKLPETYEFHRTHNSGKVQEEVEKVLRRSNYSFITIALKKSRKSIGYADLAEHLVDKIIECGLGDLTIIMDSNPVLYKQLMKFKKMRGLRKIKIKEGKSDKHFNLQLADYIVNLSYRYVKGSRNSEKDLKRFSKHILDIEIKHL